MFWSAGVISARGGALAARGCAISAEGAPCLNKYEVSHDKCMKYQLSSAAFHPQLFILGLFLPIVKRRQWLTSRCFYAYGDEPVKTKVDEISKPFASVFLWEQPSGRLILLSTSQNIVLQIVISGTILAPSGSSQPNVLTCWPLTNSSTPLYVLVELLPMETMLKSTQLLLRSSTMSSYLEKISIRVIFIRVIVTETRTINVLLISACLFQNAGLEREPTPIQICC